MSIQERMAELNNLVQRYIFYAILPNNMQKKRYLILHFNISQIYVFVFLNDTIAHILDVKPASLRTLRSRITGRER